MAISKAQLKTPYADCQHVEGTGAEEKYSNGVHPTLFPVCRIPNDLTVAYWPSKQGFLLIPRYSCTVLHCRYLGF